MSDGLSEIAQGEDERGAVGAARVPTSASSGVSRADHSTSATPHTHIAFASHRICRECGGDPWAMPGNPSICTCTIACIPQGLPQGQSCRLREGLDRPRLLDLFCGAGGATTGYYRAGFDVMGVDIEPQPNYPLEFVQADALSFVRSLLDGTRTEEFDAIHASPPCQAFSLASLYHGKQNQERHPDLIAPLRGLLWKTGLPFSIENVAGAPIRKDVMLCGEMFGLRVHRHRYFETHGFFVMQPKHSKHRLKAAIHNCHIEEGHTRLVAGNYADHADASDAMGIDWMNREELAEAIPPAYTEFIGKALLAHVHQETAA